MKKYKVSENNISVVHEGVIEYNAERDFTTLECWKKTRDVKLFFYKKIIPILSKEEEFNLKIQIRKASVSVTANISEGYGRFHYQEGIQFYRISRGSLYELKDHLITCLNFDFVDKKLYNEGMQLIETAKRTLNGYIRFVINQKQKLTTK